MSQYHINPKTGNPGICRAESKCPFGGADEHYTTKAAAREAFEKSASGKSAISRPKPKTPRKPRVVEPVIEPTIPRRITDNHIRFYGATSEEEFKKLNAHLGRKFTANPRARVKLSDRWGWGLGVTYIGYDAESSQYFVGKSRMQMVQKFFTSPDLASTIKFAADETGYEESEYDPIDWDE